MLHVELLPDAAVEAAVRDDWARLEEAGLPNLSRHRSSSNRPHLTLSIHDDAAAPGGGPEVADRLADLLAVLPLPLRAGAVGLFGAGPFVLVRTVAVGPAHLALLGRVQDVLGPPAVRHCEPGSWVPHLTLAQRLTAGQVAGALDVLGPAPGGRLERLRVWDSTRREVLDLEP